MFKLALSAGHGLYTAGKRCLKALDENETREWTLNSRVCNKIEQKLKFYEGYELIRLDDTTGKTDVALATRTKKANDFGADFYLSIHHNAGVNGGKGGGVIAITYLNVDSQTTAWQSELYNAVIERTGLRGNRSQPLQKQNLHEVRESKMPAVLLECGFMDSSTDVPIILSDSHAEKVADACVGVIARRGGLKKKAQAPEKTVDELAREVITGKWGNGAERRERLTAAGFDYSAVQARVNELAKGAETTSNPSKKSNEIIASEVIAGLWGNGEERKQRLADAGYNYQAIQSIVNKTLKG